MARRKTDKLLQIPLTPEQLDAITKEATANQLTINQFIRSLLATHIPAFPEDVRREYVKKPKVI